MMNAAEKLAREISRVTILRCRYEDYSSLSLRRMGGCTLTLVNVEPAIIMMNAALEQAFIAAGSNDALTVLKSLADLEGFEK